MKEFTESMPFVIFFMSVTVLLQSFTNERVTNGFATRVNEYGCYKFGQVYKTIK